MARVNDYYSMDCSPEYEINNNLNSSSFKHASFHSATDQILPDEILQYQIIPFLDVESLCCKFSLISSHLYKLSEDNLLWRERFFNTLPCSQLEFFQNNPLYWKQCYNSKSTRNYFLSLSPALQERIYPSLDAFSVNFKDLYRTTFVEGRLEGNRLLNSGNYKRDQFSHHITYYYLIDIAQSMRLPNEELRLIDKIFGQSVSPTVEFFRGRTREKGALHDDETREYYGVFGIVIGIYFVMYQEWMSNDLRAHVVGRKLTHRTKEIPREDESQRMDLSYLRRDDSAFDYKFFYNEKIANQKQSDDSELMKFVNGDESSYPQYLYLNQSTEDKWDQRLKSNPVSMTIHGVWSDNKERCGLFTSENIDWSTSIFDLATLGSKLHDVNYRRVYSVENEVKIFSKLTAHKYWKMTTYVKMDTAMVNYQSTEYNVTFDCDAYVRGEAAIAIPHNISQSGPSFPHQQHHTHFQIVGNAVDSYFSFNLLNRGEHVFLAWCMFDDMKQESKLKSEQALRTKVITPNENPILPEKIYSEERRKLVSDHVAISTDQFKLSGILLDRDGVKGYIELEPRIHHKQIVKIQQ